MNKEINLKEEESRTNYNFLAGLILFPVKRNKILRWFNEVAKPWIEEEKFGSVSYKVRQIDNSNFSIRYTLYSCLDYNKYGEGCNGCPKRKNSGECGRFNLYIDKNGTIYYEGTKKAYYSEKELEELLKEFDGDLQIYLLNN